MASNTSYQDQESCPICGGSGWEPVEDKGVRRCSCKTAEQANLLWEHARIPERYRKCSFDSFFPHNQSLRRAVIDSKRFVKEYPIVEVGLLYLGSCGVGKTHLAVAVLTEIVKKGSSGLFYDFRDLLKGIQDSYNPDTHTSELKILAPVFEAEVLVLDELGASKPTEWVQETITHIITKRYNDKKTTIFTSNYLDLEESVDDGQLADRLRARVRDESLTDRVGKRLRSRLHEMCKLVLIEGEDYREKVIRSNWPRSTP
jgi:DNA replication protein DnaC